MANESAAAQSKLAVLVLLLRFHHIAASIGEIRRRFGDDIGVPEMLRCAKEFGLKARTHRSNWRRLIKAPLPGIAVLRDGGCLLPVKATEHGILVQNPLSPQPIIMSRAEFEAIWDGSLILMAPRTGLVDLSRRFGIGWRLGAIHKSFFLRLSVLVPSLFCGLRKKIGVQHVDDGVENGDEPDGELFVATDTPAAAQSTLAAFVLLLRFHGIGADPEQIRHRFGDGFGAVEMLRCAKEFGLKARTYRSSWQRLNRTPLPCIAVLRDGRHLLLGKASEDQVLVQDPMSPRPAIMSRAEFEAVWDGRLI